jgi:hypothetical protein
MKLFPIILGLSFFIISCNSKNDSKLFDKYCQSVKIIETPYTLRCGLWEKDYEGWNQDTTLQQQLNLPVKIVGKLYQTEANVVLLNGVPGDDIYPELLSFTRNGLPIDTLFLGGSCQGDPGYLGISTVIFAQNNTIEKYDTVWTWAIDSLGKKISGLDSTSVETSKFKLESSGRFITIFSEKKFITK